VIRRRTKVFGRYTRVTCWAADGIVLLARDDELERDVALNFIPTSLVDSCDLISSSHETNAASN